MDNAFAYDTALPNPSSNYTEISDVNINNIKSVTLTAQWSLISYVKNFSYTGAAQTFTAPYSGYYKLETWGASGEGTVLTKYNSASLLARGGYGAYSSGQIQVTKSTNLSVYIGQKGVENGSAWNGGAEALNGNHCKGVSGGGATDIRTVSGNWDSTGSLRSRIMVAGAGGGGTNYASDSSAEKLCDNVTIQQANGGDAGGLFAYTGSMTTTARNMQTAPGGGSQVTGGATSTFKNSNGDLQLGEAGSFGKGGRFYTSFEAGWGGGGSGAGGWYGGGGSGVASGVLSSGGGGSSYISGHTGSVAVASTSSSSPKSACTTGTTNNACSISPYINPATNAGYTFTNTVMIDGAGYKWTNTKGALTAMPNPSGGNYASGVGHSGNGYARITWLGDTI